MYSEHGLTHILTSPLFYSPVLGPLIGGFIGETVGWRWIYWVLFIFIGCVWVTTFFVPETFAVVLVLFTFHQRRMY